MGYGGSPTGPDSWTSDRLSSSASVFRSVVFTSPDDNHVRPARRSTHAPHRMQKKLSSRTVNRTSRTTIRNRVSLPTSGTAAVINAPPPWAPWAPWRRANEASVTYLLTSKCHFELVSVRAPGHPARSRGPVPRHCRGTAAAIPMAMPNTKDGPRPRSNRPTCHTCHSSRAHHGALSGGSAALQRCSSGLKVLAHATTLDDATHQARL